MHNKESRITFDKNTEVFFVNCADGSIPFENRLGDSDVLLRSIISSSHKCHQFFNITIVPTEYKAGIEWLSEHNLYVFNKHKWIVDKLSHIVHDVLPSSYVSVMLHRLNNADVRTYQLL